MNLKDVFDMLSYGEFAQIKIGAQPLSHANPDHVSQLISHVNLALQDLYRRFSIVRGEVKLKLVPGTYRYVLNTDASLYLAYKNADEWIANNPNVPAPIIDPAKYYIQDRGNPFKGDINKIEKLTLANRYKYDLPINDSNIMSAKNPSQLELIIPEAIVDGKDLIGDWLGADVVNVEYRAKHVNIVRDSSKYFEACNVEVPLPDLYTQAMLYFIAFRVLTPIGSMEEDKPGNNYYNKYYQECQNLLALGFELTECNTVTTLRSRGFV